MINIKSLASSSAGNAYLISDGRFPILIEMGIPWRRIQKELDYRTSEIQAALLSHEHMDHAKAWKDVARAGIDIYMSRGTAGALEASSHRIKPIDPYKWFRVGPWDIYPMSARHDAAEPLIFLLLNKSDERLLFATDTFYIKERIPGLTHILIECNHATDILRANVQNGSIPVAMKNRLLQSHLNLGNVKKFLQANDLSRVQQIWLLHLSEGNSDAARFKREIQQLTGKLVIVADA